MIIQANSFHIPLRDRSIQCIVTSPPYWGLRDYGLPPIIIGGEPACEHEWGEQIVIHKGGIGGEENSFIMKGRAASIAQTGRAGVRNQQCGDFCRHCNAWRGQLGLEPSPELYVEHMVEIFQECWRVLRDDGVVFCNLGDSYWGGKGQSAQAWSSSHLERDTLEKKQHQITGKGETRALDVRANLSNSLNGLMKGQPLIFGNAATIGITSQSGNVPLQDDGFPYRVFLSLLGIERVTIKQRNNNFCQVLHTLANPCYCWISYPVAFMSRNVSNLEIVLDAGDDIGIVISNHDANGKPVLGVTGIVGRSGKGGDSSFAVKETGKPITEYIPSGVTIGNAVALDAVLERLPDVYFVYEPVSLRNRLDAPASNVCDFRITKATYEQVAFSTCGGRINLTAIDVTHLYTLNSFGSFVHYKELYDKATKKARRNQAKQLAGIPWRVVMALQEDGWILRSDCIWSKPNPMPESVTDRPTKAHEYIFLLSKQLRYFYDAEAVRESYIDVEKEARKTKIGGFRYEEHGSKKNGKARAEFYNHSGRNLRSVWQIATQPYKDAHFATFPVELAARCIKAGTSEKGCCVSCGAPWERIVETKYLSKIQTTGNEDGRYERGRNRNVVRMGDGVDTKTIGWRPTCQCNAGEPVPCVALDPFGGSGTTVETANRLGRRGLSLEIKPSYCELAVKRVRKSQTSLL